MKIRNWEALNKELNLWALMAIVVAIVVSAIGVLVMIQTFEVCEQYYPDNIKACMLSPRYVVPNTHWIMDRAFMMTNDEGRAMCILVDENLLHIDHTD